MLRQNQFYSIGPRRLWTASTFTTQSIPKPCPFKPMLSFKWESSNMPLSFITGEAGKQCDQIGRFFEFLDEQFSHKICPDTLVNFWAILNSTSYMFKMIWLLFRQYRGKLGNIFFHHLVTLQVRQIQCDQMVWLCFNIWPFETNKICPVFIKFAKVSLIFCQIRNKLSKICQGLVKFCQSGKNLPNLVTLNTISWSHSWI